MKINVASRNVPCNILKHLEDFLEDLTVLAMRRVLKTALLHIYLFLGRLDRTLISSLLLV